MDCSWLKYTRGHGKLRLSQKMLIFCQIAHNGNLWIISPNHFFQQTLQSFCGRLGENHWAQKVLRLLFMHRPIRTYQIFDIWDSHLGPKASLIKGVELGISNIANYNNIFRLKSVHVTNPKGFTVDWMDSTVLIVNVFKRVDLVFSWRTEMEY